MYGVVRWYRIYSRLLTHTAQGWIYLRLLTILHESRAQGSIVNGPGDVLYAEDPSMH